MTTRLHHFTFGLLALVCATVISSCSTEETGQTLVVKFNTESGLTMAKTAGGTPAQPFVPAIPATTTSPIVPAIPAVAATPDTYSGTVVIAANVTYSGKDALTYKWSFSLPYPLTGSGTSATDVLTIKVTGFSNPGTPLAIPVNATGTAVLEVFTKDGRQYQKASSTFPVVLGYSG